MGTKRFSNPQALSSALAALGTLQPRAIGLLNRLVPLVLASNYYIVKKSENEDTLTANHCLFHFMCQPPFLNITIISYHINIISPSFILRYLFVTGPEKTGLIYKKYTYVCVLWCISPFLCMLSNFCKLYWIL